jgi:hypothetical protein
MCGAKPSSGSGVDNAPRRDCYGCVGRSTLTGLGCGDRPYKTEHNLTKRNRKRKERERKERDIQGVVEKRNACP